MFETDSNVVFIGTDAPEAGHLQGKMVGQYALEHYDEVDLNGDGKISNAMFMGDKGYNKDSAYVIPVFGVDAIDPAKELIKEGAMAGAIKQDVLLKMVDITKTFPGV